MIESRDSASGHLKPKALSRPESKNSVDNFQLKSTYEIVIPSYIRWYCTNFSSGEISLKCWAPNNCVKNLNLVIHDGYSYTTIEACQ